MAVNTDVRHSKSARRLQSIINSYGIKPIDLSRATGINRATISRYLSGEYTPSDENARKLAETLKVSASWLQGRDDIENLHQLTTNYNSLNEIGKDRILEYSEILKESDKFSRGDSK